MGNGKIDIAEIQAKVVIWEHEFSWPTDRLHDLNWPKYYPENEKTSADPTDISPQSLQINENTSKKGDFAAIWKSWPGPPPEFGGDVNT